MPETENPSLGSQVALWRTILAVVLALIPAVMVFYYYQGGYQKASLPAIVSARNFPQIPLILITPLILSYVLVRASRRGRIGVIIWSCLVFAMTCIGRWPNQSDTTTSTIVESVDGGEFGRPEAVESKDKDQQ